MAPRVDALCISEKKGVQKTEVASAELRRNYGIINDAHAGGWHRQVSLLPLEQVDYMRDKGLQLDSGAFGENIITADFDLASLAVGDRFRVGETVLQLTQIGKECHTRCAIFYSAGECIMPTKGVFARVLCGGVIKPGDQVESGGELAGYRLIILDASESNREELFKKAAAGFDGTLIVNYRNIRAEEVQTVPEQIYKTEFCDGVILAGGLSAEAIGKIGEIDFSEAAPKPLGDRSRFITVDPTFAIIEPADDELEQAAGIFGAIPALLDEQFSAK